MENKCLTGKDHWEHRWGRIKQSAQIRRDTEQPLAKDISRVFDTYLPHQTGLTILEIGGAPENFDIMNLDITIYNSDIFSDLSDPPRFDIVLSREFIEHFGSPDLVVTKHVELLKKDGVLVLGVPNFC